MKIAVIGTAGRKEDASKLSKEVYEAMYQDLLSRVSLEDTLVSGGAAYADHLAVRAYLDGHVKHLVLHMPFTTKHAKCAQVSMYYYDRMYAVTGINVRADINAAIKKGAEVTTQPDTQNYSPMANRNKLVANDGDLLIAYTFGEGDVPKDGGTEITWDMSQGKKIHVPIHLLHIDEGSYLGDTAMKLTVTGSYTAKDQLKADRANKFIGRGSDRSSTNQYRKDYGDNANCGVYEPTDVVFISAEGNRQGRLMPDAEELKLALRAGVTFITDGEYDRQRPYNIGERQIAFFLNKYGYQEVSSGVWKPIMNS